MIKFKKQIFMGNGQNSMAECYHAHKLLEDALNILNDIQQEGLYGTSIDVVESKMQKYEYAKTIRELMIGLTGKKMSISKILKMINKGTQTIEDIVDDKFD